MEKYRGCPRAVGVLLVLTITALVIVGGDPRAVGVLKFDKGKEVCLCGNFSISLSYDKMTLSFFVEKLLNY